MSARVRVGLSTCPNDTFAFHAWLTGAVEAEGLDVEFVLLDVEELNERTLAGELDASKVSFAAALELGERALVLPCGAALGFGVGPVVLRAAPGPPPPEPRVLLPGRWTTAALLWRTFHPEPARLAHAVFSDIVPALERGEADLGVCIHEARFTYRERGLALGEGLGETWESATGLALPLGGVVVRRERGHDVARALARALSASLEHARRAPEACLPTMRQHAQEHDDDVLRAHVELYVNEWTADLGATGRAALAELARRAGGAPLTVLDG